MKINNVLKSIFEVIKKEELDSLKEEVGQSMADAYNRLGSLSSSDFSGKIRKLCRKYIQEISDKVINTLKPEQFNKHITKDNITFINEMDGCIEDISETISNMIGKNRLSEEDLETLINKNINSLSALKEDIIKQWNKEAEIINLKKQSPIKNFFTNKITTGIIIGVTVGIVMSFINYIIKINKPFMGETSNPRTISKMQ